MRLCSNPKSSTIWYNVHKIEPASMWSSNTRLKSQREAIKIERAYVLSQANYPDCSVASIRTRTAAFCLTSNC